MILVDLVIGESLGVNFRAIESINEDEDDPFRSVLKMAEYEGIDVAEVRQSLEPAPAVEEAPPAKEVKTKKAKVSLNADWPFPLPGTAKAEV